MIRASRICLLCVCVAATILAATSVAQAVTIALTSPSGTETYRSGTRIEFAGNGSWNIELPTPETATTDVNIDLVWFEDTDETDYDEGTSFKGTSAVVTFEEDSNGKLTGTYTFKNPTVDGVPGGKSTFTASKYLNKIKYYRIFATPERKHGPYFVNGKEVRTSRNIGVIN